MPELQLIIAYLALGLFVGFFSGLLGIGGGLFMVPVLLFLLEAQGIPQHLIMHLALGTSMATILFTSLSSAYQHHVHGAVNWQIFRYMTPGILTGTALGAVVIAFIATRYLTMFFVLFMYVMAIHMLFNRRPEVKGSAPGRMGMTLSGMVIGAISSVVSIGGGALSVPYLAWHAVPLRKAIATSAALGFPIAVGGTVGYIINGQLAGVELPSFSLGYVYLPALLWMVIATAITAPLGAKATHRLPVEIVRKIFAVMLLMLASRMLYKIFYN